MPEQRLDFSDFWVSGCTPGCPLDSSVGKDARVSPRGPACAEDLPRDRGSLGVYHVRTASYGRQQGDLPPTLPKSGPVPEIKIPRVFSPFMISSTTTAYPVFHRKFRIPYTGYACPTPHPVLPAPVFLSSSRILLRILYSPAYPVFSCASIFSCVSRILLRITYSPAYPVFPDTSHYITQHRLPFPHPVQALPLTICLPPHFLPCPSASLFSHPLPFSTPFSCLTPTRSAVPCAVCHSLRGLLYPRPL
jgi:hypothetical protein